MANKVLVAMAFIYALIFSASISEAGVVTDRTPLQCYVDKRVDSYNAPGGQKVGWIDPEVDLIQVLEIRPDGWARGTHPSGQRRVERWFRIADLCADPGYSNRGVRINGYRDVYRTRGSNTKFGSVSNEDVIVLAEFGNRSQILYNISGGYKMGWIVNSNPVPNPQPGGDYNSKVRAFVNDSRYRPGTRWDNCYTYASQFTSYVFGKSNPHQGQWFGSADEIRNGDVVHVNASGNKSQHWLVVLYRNGNQLTTIEGNWTNHTVNYSDSAYTIQNGTLYRNGSRFRVWDCGYHFQ